MAKPVAGFNVNPENINREGRPPKEWTWAGLIKEKMEELLPGTDKKYVKDAVATALAEKAISGDVPAIKEIGDRIDGKARQDIKHEGELTLTGLVQVNPTHEHKPE